MELLKKIYAWEMKQARKPETLMAAGIAIGLVLGIGMDNIAVGIALGVAIGAGMQVQSKKALEKKSEKDKGITKNEPK